VSISTARSLPLAVVTERTESAGAEAPALTRREATLRSAATGCLAGIAVVQAIELPFLRVQGGQFLVLSMVAMAACIALGLALAAAPQRASRQVWGLVAVAGVVGFASWLAPRLTTVPGLAHHVGHWVTPGGIAGVLGVACVALSAAAVRPTVRGLVTSFAMLVALVPGVAALLVSLGPGLAGGETSLSANVHVHAHGLDETLIRFQPIAGGRGGHYVYQGIAQPHLTVLGVALLAAATTIFIYGAVGHLRRRSAPADAGTLDNLEGGLA